MTIYRVYVADILPRAWVEYIEADSEQEAKAKCDAYEGAWAWLEVKALPDEMDSPCLCSETPVKFVHGPANYPTHRSIWTCQNCGNEYICPPDEIDWTVERNADSQEDEWGELPTFWRERGTEQEDNRLPFSDPYYEDDVTLELED